MSHSVLALLMLGVLFRVSSNACCAAVFGYRGVGSLLYVFLALLLWFILCSAWSLQYVLLESFRVGALQLQWI